MAQCMNVLPEKVQKQELSAMHTVICTPVHNMHGRNSLYIISSSKFSANWHATATYRDGC